MLVNRKRLAVKEVENFNSEISRLKGEKKQLTDQLTIKLPISKHLFRDIFLPRLMVLRLCSPPKLLEI
jgi:hypothetical protein